MSLGCEKTKSYFQNMLFLLDSPYPKLLFYMISTIIKAFIMTGHQFLYPVLVERGRPWLQTAVRFAARHACYHEIVELHISDDEYQPVAHFLHLKTDKRPYFTVGGALHHLEHFKRTEQHVNTVCFSRICVCGLPMNDGKQRACVKWRPQRCGGNIRKLYFSYTIRT